MGVSELALAIVRVTNIGALASYTYICGKILRKPFVYVVRKRALGDVLWIEPLIRQLAARNKKVIVYTKYPELFLHYPLPHIEFKSSLSLFEKIIWKLERFFHRSFFFIDLETAYEGQPKMHFLHAYQQSAKLPVTTEYPRLYLDEKERAFGSPVPGKYVVLHLESMTDRNYRKVYGVNWEAIAASLKLKGFTVLLIGKEPAPVAGAIPVKTSIREMMGLIGNASFFLGIDSGPSHIAAALGIPSLVFFGAVNPDFRHFMELFKGRILQQYCEFAGCYHERVGAMEPSCRLVGDEGVPKCSLHTTEYVLNNINLLLKDYHIS